MDGGSVLPSVGPPSKAGDREEEAWPLADSPVEAWKAKTNYNNNKRGEQARFDPSACSV